MPKILTLYLLFLYHCYENPCVSARIIQLAQNIAFLTLIKLLAKCTYTLLPENYHACFIHEIYILPCLF